MLTALCVLGWIVCGAPYYLLVRRDFRKSKLPWTVGNRRLFMLLAAVIGPTSVFAAPVYLAQRWLGDKTPADW